MDIVRSFTYIFDDDDWVSKILVTAFIGIIPIINFAIFGWVISLIKNMQDGVEHPLPDWSDFGDKFTTGIMYCLASLMYNLPIVAVICLMAFSAMIFGQGSGAEGILFGSMCGLAVAIVLYAIVANVLVFVGTVRYARDLDFNVYMQFGENYRIAMANINVLLMLVLYAFLASLVIGAFGWIPCLGQVAAFAFGTPVMAHLQGQAAVIMMEKPKRGMA